MATKLALYNAVLSEIGDDTIASLTANSGARRVIDTVYDDVLAECLRDGQWNFALRTVKLDADTGITPAFGYTYVFAKPDDWVRTVGLSASEDFVPPLTRYMDEAGNILADVDPIYFRFVSDGESYGGDLTAWPADYRRFVELSIAGRVVERITQNASKGEIIRRDLKEAKRKALSRDAMDDAGPRFRPPGSWTTARRGGWSNRDRTGNSLIG